MAGVMITYLFLRKVKSVNTVGIQRSPIKTGGGEEKTNWMRPKYKLSDSAIDKSLL